MAATTPPYPTDHGASIFNPPGIARPAGTKPVPDGGQAITVRIGPWRPPKK